MNEDCRLS